MEKVNILYYRVIYIFYINKKLYLKFQLTPTMVNGSTMLLGKEIINDKTQTNQMYLFVLIHIYIYIFILFMLVLRYIQIQNFLFSNIIFKIRIYILF